MKSLSALNEGKGMKIYGFVYIKKQNKKSKTVFSNILLD